MNEETLQISLKDLLRDGSFGPVELGMSREEVKEILGPPDGVMTRRKDKTPTAFVYGKQEFYFVSSTDNRLCAIYLDQFFSRRSILAQVSRRPIVRLNTSFPDSEAGSKQK